MSEMIEVSINVHGLLLILFFIAFLCTAGLLLTDKTDAVYNVMHYILYIAAFCLLFTLLILTMFFVEGP